jgi:hypothetical protein
MIIKKSKINESVRGERISMAIIIHYFIDKNIYFDAQTEHNISLVTTEYICGSNILVHSEQGGNLNVRLKNLLDYTLNKDSAINKDNFFIKKTYSKEKARPITQSTFEDRLKRFNADKTVIEQEILDEYGYTDKTGKLDKVQITVLIKSGRTLGVIDFKDAGQLENFVYPAWLDDIDMTQIN